MWNNAPYVTNIQELAEGIIFSRDRIRENNHLKWAKKACCCWLSRAFGKMRHFLSLRNSTKATNCTLKFCSIKLFHGQNKVLFFVGFFHLIFILSSAIYIYHTKHILLFWSIWPKICYKSSEQETEKLSCCLHKIAVFNNSLKVFTVASHQSTQKW